SRVIVGGNLTISNSKTYGACSNASYACPGNATAAVDANTQRYGALTVFGNLAAPNATLKAGFNTTASIRAANGNTAYINGSAGVTAQALPAGTTGLFTANADWTSNGMTYGVVTTTLTNLAQQTAFTGISNGSNAATLVIVTGNSMDSTDASYNSSLMLPNL